jgi:hypothetical protein
VDEKTYGKSIDELSGGQQFALLGCFPIGCACMILVPIVAVLVLLAMAAAR